MASITYFGERRNVLEPKIESLPGERVDDMGGVADEASRGATNSRASCSRSGKLWMLSSTVTLPSDEPIAASISPATSSSGSALSRAASSVVSVHTSDERLPGSGRLANGPAGRKCS